MNIMLVGVGPHAKRIYLPYLKKNNINPTIIIELDEKKSSLQNYLKEKDVNAELYFINNFFRDSEYLCDMDSIAINKLVKKNGITHAIISSEPKSHKAYIIFCLLNNINVLVDKPLTAYTDVSTNLVQAKKISNDYLEIEKYYSASSANLMIQCQRRWHKGYKFIYNLANEFVNDFQVPITSLAVSHCDGMWNMPNELLSRENHPYKYGYGKLMHSGYHFIDLALWLEKINFDLNDKCPDKLSIVTHALKTNDFLTAIGEKEYECFFERADYKNIFQSLKQGGIDKYGEIDCYSFLQLKKNSRVISNISISLQQSGFSRRSWNNLPQDTYKSNGRVRHEYLNIEIGPLANIQVHSYQSKEIKDRLLNSCDVGEVEHFDIYIFRNTGIIGGRPFQKIQLKDLVSNKEKFIKEGENETAREVCIEEFLKKNQKDNSFYKNKLGIDVLSKMYEGLALKYLTGKTIELEMELG